jgi:hypothetical protein
MVRGIMHIRRLRAVSLGVLAAVAVLPVHAQRNNNNAPKPTPQDVDLAALYQTVDAVVAGTQQPPADIPVTMVQHHLLMTQSGAVMVPFTVSVDKSKVAGPAIVYLRVVDKDAPMGTPAAAPAPPPQSGNNRDRDRNRNQQQPPAPAGPTFPVSTLFTLDVPADGQVARAIELKPGRYELFYAIKERSTTVPDPKTPPAPIKAGVLRHELTIPDMSVGLNTSSVILANSIEEAKPPVPADQQAANPYTIGGVLKISPNHAGKFAKAAEMAVVFWVYGVTSVQGKPDVSVEYTFHRKEGAGEKYFNKTQPQEHNAQTVGPQFNLDAGHQLMAILGLPMASFPAGDYRLEIKTTDKPSGKSLTQNVTFTVLPA